jgi:hypothetical protein
LVLVVLAMVWIAVLVPPAIRARSEGRPGDSITSFRRQLAVLQRTGPRSSRLAYDNRLRATDLRGHGVVRPFPAAASVGRPVTAASLSSARQRTLKRRRDVFAALLAAMGATLVISLIPGLRLFFVVHLLADALFAGYVALLVHLRNRRVEQDMKVRFLPGPAAVEPALLLRRSAN